MSFEGRVAFVTGGARGLGRGAVDRLVAEGATVVATDVTAPADRAFDSELQPGRANFLRVDSTDAPGVQSAVDEVLQTFGRLDILVANAGISIPPSRIVDAQQADIDRILSVNIVGTLNAVRAAVPHLQTNGGGRIITMSSQTGKDAWADWGVYSGTKAFVIAMTQALAKEHARDGITANALCPGTMVSDMMYSGFTARAAASGLTMQQEIENYERSMIPAGRMGTPADVGAMVAWLASDDASFVTGAALNLTGGEMTFF